MIQLYHTSNVEVRIPDVRHSREHLDFGRGFYLTSLREQALDQLRFKHPNHQVCITNQLILDKHLRFIESIKL